MWLLRPQLSLCSQAKPAPLHPTKLGLPQLTGELDIGKFSLLWLAVVIYIIILAALPVSYFYAFIFAKTLAMQDSVFLIGKSTTGCHGS